MPVTYFSCGGRGALRGSNRMIEYIIIIQNEKILNEMYHTYKYFWIHSWLDFLFCANEPVSFSDPIIIEKVVEVEMFFYIP